MFIRTYTDISSPSLYLKPLQDNPRLLAYINWLQSNQDRFDELVSSIREAIGADSQPSTIPSRVGCLRMADHAGEEPAPAAV